MHTHRAVYREDIQLLKEKLRSKEQEVGVEGKKAGLVEGKKAGQVEGKKAGQGEESTSFKDEVPPNSLSLQFVHGYVGVCKGMQGYAGVCKGMQGYAGVYRGM